LFLLLVHSVIVGHLLLFISQVTVTVTMFLRKPTIVSLQHTGLGSFSLRWLTYLLNAIGFIRSFEPISVTVHYTVICVCVKYGM